jgi:hypothetical protein
MEHRSRRAAREGCVELMQAIETPPAILIRWPAAPTVTDLRRFPAAALASEFARADRPMWAERKETADRRRDWLVAG